LEAYTQGANLVYGGKSFPSSRIKGIVEGLHIYVFPLVNPDGHNYCQTQNPLWRKNRRFLYQNLYGKVFGVDINRNYDFVWDYTEFFSLPSSEIEKHTSNIELADTYIGEAAFSEAETKNVRWMFDMNPRIKRFVDIHSYGELVLYPWGDDENQTTNPAMNFMNPAFDWKRGVTGDDYKEYALEPDLKVMSETAIRVRDAIEAVRGKHYTAKQNYYLYPTSGTSIDYAYSRHIVDPKKTKVFSFTIEWGTEHQPPWAEMENIILDITAGLIELCPAPLSPPDPIIIVHQKPD
jgi:murein tripeptide amidase MpaA